MGLAFGSEFAPLCPILVFVIGAMWMSPLATFQLFPCCSRLGVRGDDGCFDIVYGLVHSVLWLVGLVP